MPALRRHLVVGAAALAATLALAPVASARGDTQRQNPLPPGACATHGAAGLAYAVGVNCRVVDVDGHPRRFVVYVPDRPPVTGSRTPVVFMFHGSTGSGEQVLRTSGWREQADATGAVAVFPTGLRYRVLESGRLSTKWNDGDLRNEVDLDERPAGYPAHAPWPADDVGFVDSIVSDLSSQLPVDPRRLYASGFSNGAAFTARLAVERSTVLAAAAFAGGSLHEPRAIERPVPMYLVGGTLDENVLEHTGPPPLTELPLDPLALLTEPIVQSAIAAHVSTLGLDATDFGTVGRPHSTSFRWPAAGTGPGGGLFRFAMVEGLRHQYPNATNNPAGFAAAPEFWSFFESNPLP
jgi:polyhydroxybutyrate depolymerase